MFKNMFKNMFVKHDGRVGPFWEHLAWTIPWFVVAAEMLSFLFPVFLPMNTLHLIAVLWGIVVAGRTYKADVRLNSSMVAEVDQTVPADSYTYFALTVVLVAYSLLKTV